VMGDVLQDDEGIAYAEIDLNRCVEPKQFHDVVGYYNRFDIFDLSVNRTRLTPARFHDNARAAVLTEPTPAMPKSAGAAADDGSRASLEQDV
jgi:nitrilase